MKCLDLLYAARESRPDSLGRTAGTLKDFIEDGTYNDKYAKFRDCLAIHLSKKSELDIEESKNVVDKTMKNYLGSSMFTLRLKAGIKRIIDKSTLLERFYLSYRHFKFSGNSPPVKVGMRAVSCEAGQALLENPLSTTPVKAWVSINRNKQTPKLNNLPPIEYDNPENEYYQDFIRIKKAIENSIVK